MYTKREARILDDYYREYHQIRPPTKPFKQEDFDDYFIKKYSREAFFNYISDNHEGTNLTDCINKFIAAVQITNRSVHAESVLSRCLAEEFRFAKEVLKALSKC